MDHCPEGLPRAAYFETDWYRREMESIFARQWVMVGRAEAFQPGKMCKVQVGAAAVILLRDEAGALKGWHNSCPHRGSELCREAEEPVGAS